MTHGIRNKTARVPEFFVRRTVDCYSVRLRGDRASIVAKELTFIERSGVKAVLQKLPTARTYPVVETPPLSYYQLVGHQAISHGTSVRFPAVCCHSCAADSTCECVAVWCRRWPSDCLVCHPGYCRTMCCTGLHCTETGHRLNWYHIRTRYILMVE